MQYVGLNTIPDLHSVGCVALLAIHYLTSLHLPDLEVFLVICCLLKFSNVKVNYQSCHSWL